MNNFYAKTLNQDTPQITVYSKASIPSAMLSRRFVFVLSIAVLPDLVKDNFVNFEVANQEKNWYNQDEVVGMIRFVNC